MPHDPVSYLHCRFLSPYYTFILFFSIALQALDVCFKNVELIFVIRRVSCEPHGCVMLITLFGSDVKRQGLYAFSEL